MTYLDLRDFIKQLETKLLLKRINLNVDPYLEITEICDRVLKKAGPALLFTQPKNFSTPVLANLFGTPQRIALAMGCEDLSGLRELGGVLATLKEPEPPQGFRDILNKLPLLKQVLTMNPKKISKG